MSEDEIKKIYSVASYPHNDLSHLIPGAPPDKDFSIAKPSNQTQANTFAAYLEPYFRPYTEEDLAWLRERGDRVNAFIVPPRGKKHYTELWAEEDGLHPNDPSIQGRDRYPANQPRGSIEALDDATAESDLISLGPVASRVLQCLRPERRIVNPEDKSNGHVNGNDSVNGDINGDNHEERESTAVPSATCMPGSDTEAWKKANHPKLDYAQVDERLKQELRHLGILPPEVEPDYDGHYDDEVAARLRFLQARLKEICIQNGARKARLQRLVQEQMAYQEYSTICEDLENQVNQAYLKRTRTMGKNKKTKRPGGAGGGATAGGPPAGTAIAKPGIGDSVKALMDRKRRWEDTFSVIFDDQRRFAQVPRSKDPNSSIFKAEDMADYITKERDTWDEEGDDE